MKNKIDKDKESGEEKNLDNRDYYYDAEIGQISGETDQLGKSSKQAETEAEKLLKKYKDNGIKSI